MHTKECATSDSRVRRDPPDRSKRMCSAAHVNTGHLKKSVKRPQNVERVAAIQMELLL